ncbi:condensation domain-containing protein [Chitinophaga ginsengisoli]|uniref:Phthiocerol/phthiodiolone dimycocerosyl transferase n=1 Tax=Chitinophaga ginsengisoli TaxID=363837 RepID=A0A2P8FZD3_9BACT|nr:condensation domain-containing protein [Chitinophaga ginsengisoli]PSL27079.1 condensation domain-containing protein [Chitinophaga ginsengisoli]
MNRQLILGERIMYVDAGATVNCIFTAKIRGALTLESLIDALGKIQQKHPLLGVVIRENENGRPYFVSDTKIPPIPVQIVERKDDDHWQAVSATEWHRTFDVRKGPLARVIWLRSNQVSELLLVLPHCICDGTSILTLMRELLQVLDKPETTLIPYPSFASIHDFIPDALSSSWKLKLKLGLLSKIAGIVLALKTRGAQPVQGKHYMVNWKLDKTATAALITACKIENTTLHAAFSLAFMEAHYQVMGAASHGKVICPVDIRRFIPEIKQDHLFAFAPIAELSISDIDTNFWTKARQLKADLTTAIDKMDVRKLLLTSEYFHTTATRMVDFLKRTDGTHDVTLSNMGKLDIPDQYDTFELETLYSPSAAFPWKNANTMVISTFRGQTDFSFISCETFLEETKARAIVQKMQELLPINPVHEPAHH